MNCVEESKDHVLIATSDDFGLMNIYRNPVKEKHLARSYRGHSEHVTNLKFNSDGEYLISTGGGDMTVI